MVEITHPSHRDTSYPSTDDGRRGTRSESATPPSSGNEIRRQKLSHFRARRAKTLQSSNLRKQIRSEVDLHPVVREIAFVLVELCCHFYRNTLITRVGRAE